MGTEFEHLLPGLARLSKSHPVPLSQVGADVCLSPDRAQRVFAASLGETPKQYQTRVRLQRAAAQLAGTDARIVDIAMAAGFDSHETFTRAFVRHFTVTPSAYRQQTPAWASAGSIRHAAATAPCVGMYRKPLRRNRTLQDRNNEETSTMSNYNIERVTLDETPVLFGRRKLEKSKIADGLAEVLPAAFGHAMSNGLEMVGPPFVRYVDQSAAFFTIEAGVPLAAPAEDPGAESDLTTGSLPGGEAAFVIHKGPYETLGEAHLALDLWTDQNGLAPTAPPWEVYITDPAEVPDPAEWITHIYQPI